MSNKWMSRKFWMSLAPMVAGIVTLICGAQAGETVTVIAGACIAIASSLGYITVEGAIDKERSGKA